METCFICCNECELSFFISCKKCNQKICKICNENIIDVKNEAFVKKCPFCVDTKKISISNISYRYLKNLIFGLNKKVKSYEDYNEGREYMINTLFIENTELREKIDILERQINHLTSKSVIYLDVKYDDKEDIKKLGGKWDYKMKLWFIYDFNENKVEILEKYKIINIH